MGRVSTIGELIWVRRLGGPGFQSPGALGMSGSKVILGGSFAVSLSLDGFQITQFSPAQNDGFVTSVGYSTGQASSMNRVSSASGVVGMQAYAIASSGNAILAGSFSGLAQFSNLDLTSVGGMDGFLVQMAAE